VGLGPIRPGRVEAGPRAQGKTPLPRPDLRRPYAPRRRNNPYCAPEPASHRLRRADGLPVWAGPARTLGSMRRPWWSLRLRVLGWTAAGIAAFAALAWFLMFCMPGSSFQGRVPQLDPAGETLRAELEADVTHLASGIGERSIARPKALAMAAEYLDDAFRSCGLTPTRETWTAQGVELANLIAEIPGNRSDQIVIVGAHYDSVTGSPGANDNATGVAALVALARRLAGSHPARTIRFIAFSGEEPPCFQTPDMGSAVHALRCRGRNERVVAMLSLESLGCWRDGAGTQEYPITGLEMILPDRGNFVSFVSDLGARGLVRDSIGAFREAALVPSEGAALPDFVPGVDWSDHASFRRLGYPAVMVTDTAIFRDSAYHQHRDTPDRVDFDRLAHTTQGLVHVVRRLAGVQ